jgi:integrase
MAHPRGIYSRQNAEGKTRWYVRIARDGRMQHFGSFPSQRAAMEFSDQVRLVRRQERLTPGYTPQMQHTIPELFAMYLPQIEHLLAYREQKRFATWWTTYWPHQRVLDLTPQHLERARVALRTSGRYHRRSEGTVNHHLKCLRHAMRSVVQPRSWVTDLWSQIKLQRPPGNPPVPLTIDDEARLYQHLNQDDAEKVRLALITGLRRAQLFGLTWERVYWRERGVSLTTIKQQRPRFLPLSEDALDILRRRWSLAGQPAQGPVFPSAHDPSLPEDAGNWYKYRFKKAVRAAGLAGKGLKFHSTRHGFGVRFLEAGGHVRALQRAGGWSSLDQVQIYTQLHDEELRQGMDQVAQIGKSNCRKLQKSKTSKSEKQRKALKTKDVAV